MEKSNKTTRLIIAGIVAGVVILGIVGFVSFTQTGHGFSMMGNGGAMSNQFGGGLQGTPAVGVQQVSLTNKDTFSPAIIQISVGTTVTWTNTDSDAHTVTFMSAMMNSGSRLTAGATSRFTFTTAGVYSYFCMYHQGMVGRVIVTG